MLENAHYFAAGLNALGYHVLSGEPLRTGPAEDAPVETILTPIIPILIGDDWKAAQLWRALYDGGVFTNCALHPAVPPGGALLRTSVMATHDHDTLDRALEVFESVKRQFEAEHGPLWPADAELTSTRESLPPEPAWAAPSPRSLPPGSCPFLHKSRRRRKRSLLAHEPMFARLTARRALLSLQKRSA